MKGGVEMRTMNRIGGYASHCRRRRRRRKRRKRKRKRRIEGRKV